MCTSRFVSILVVALVLTGCMHAQRVEKNATQVLPELNRRAGWRTSELVLKDGRTYFVQNLLVRPDSASFQLSGQDDLQHIATREIAQVIIETEEVNRPFLKGAAVGGAVGAGAGVAVMYAGGGYIHAAVLIPSTLIGGFFGGIIGSGVGESTRDVQVVYNFR